MYIYTRNVVKTTYQIPYMCETPISIPLDCVNAHIGFESWWSLENFSLVFLQSVGVFHILWCQGDHIPDNYAKIVDSMVSDFYMSLSCLQL